MMTDRCRWQWYMWGSAFAGLLHVWSQSSCILNGFSLGCSLGCHGKWHDLVRSSDSGSGCDKVKASICQAVAFGAFDICCINFSSAVEFHKAAGGLVYQARRQFLAFYWTALFAVARGMQNRGSRVGASWPLIERPVSALESLVGERLTAEALGPDRI